MAVWLAVGVPGEPQKLANDAAPVNLSHLMRRDEIVIGRGVECDVVIKDLKASRKHCRLIRRKDGFTLEDLGSKNGTYVDGERIKAPMAIRLDQAFKIGDTLFYISK